MVRSGAILIPPLLGFAVLRKIQLVEQWSFSWPCSVLGLFSFPVGTWGLALVRKEAFALSAPVLGSRAPSKKVVTVVTSLPRFVIDPTWSKFGSDDFSKAKAALFGEEFQSKLISKVEKETALAKEVSITKRHKEKDNQSARSQDSSSPGL